MTKDGIISSGRFARWVCLCLLLSLVVITSTLDETSVRRGGQALAAESAEKQAVTPKAKAPTLVGGKRQIALNWQHPAGDVIFEAYRVRYREKGAGTWTYADARALSGNQNFWGYETSATIPAHESFEMKDGTTYEVQLRAGKWNDGYPGWGEWSEVTETKTLPETTDDRAEPAAGVTLSASNVTATTATLTLAGHTGDWYWKRTAPSDGTCSSAVEGTKTTASGLTNGTRYAFKAYRDAACTSELAASETVLTFPPKPGGLSAATRRKALSLSWTAATSATSYEVHWAERKGKDGRDTDWDFAARKKVVACDDGPCASPPTAFLLEGLADGTAYGVVVRGRNASGYGAVSAPAWGTPGAATLSASGVGASSATLTIGQWDESWRYQRTTPSGGTCSAAVAKGTTASLSGLSEATGHAYAAYSGTDASCGTPLASVEFLTLPGRLSGLKAEAPVLPDSKSFFEAP